MTFSVKSVARPLVRQTISLVELATGFHTDPTGHLPNRLRMLAGEYENFLTQSICQVLPKHGVFVDIGANVGFFSHRIARRFPGVKVFAFEPNPRIYPILKRNLSGYPNCESFHLGLGAAEGNLEFYHGAESCVGSFVREYTSQHPSNSLKGPIEKSNVRVVAGDDVLVRTGTIDVIKMDVEGYEVEVLRGLSILLGQAVVKTIFFEFCPFAQKWTNHPAEQIIQLLTVADYTVREIEGENAGTPVDTGNVAALIARLGERGYTTLRANVKPEPNARN